MLNYYFKAKNDEHQFQKFGKIKTRINDGCRRQRNKQTKSESSS